MADHRYAIAVGVCIGSEIIRLRRGNPHWSWLNRYFREARIAKAGGDQ